MDDIPMWTCPVCQDLNAIGLDKCRCGELRPAAFSIKFIEPQSPLGLELLELSTPNAAKRGKSASKGKKEASKRQPIKKLYESVIWNEFDRILQFVVEGEPIAKERPRLGRGRKTYTPTKTKRYEETVAEAAKKVMGENALLGGLLQVEITIMRSNGIRADIDNCLKSIFDGMNGQIYYDDSQIAEIKNTRIVRFAKHSGVSILIRQFKQAEKKTRKAAA
jgi:crossover junction endodeoxyribonuclease RusA